MVKKLTYLVMALVVTGCAIQSASKDEFATSAVITSGGVNFWSLTSGGSIVSLVSVDGEPAKNQYGPIVLSPGRHSITMACGDSNSDFDLTVEAGEKYEFTYRVGDQSGCQGGLLKAN